MSSPQHIEALQLDNGNRCTDSALVELIDALVEAVDLNRSWEVDRLRNALEPFGACVLFDSELRLRGTASPVEGCICGGEVW